MEQEIKQDIREILAKLAKLQTDVELIKSQIGLEKDALKEKAVDDELRKEMMALEEASEEDILNWEKENL